MLASGLTLMRALEILKDQMQNQNMSEIVTTIINDVEEGKTLAQAIENILKLFPQFIFQLFGPENNQDF